MMWLIASEEERGRLGASCSRGRAVNNLALKGRPVLDMGRDRGRDRRALALVRYT